MKKPKLVKPYFFKDLTHREFIDLLNQQNPISLRYNESLINRVHARYPLLDKSSIAIIVSAVFQSFRDLLLLGKVLNFNNFIFNTRLYFFNHRQGGNIFPAVKVRVSTPPPLRKI